MDTKVKFERKQQRSLYAHGTKRLCHALFIRVLILFRVIDVGNKLGEQFLRTGESGGRGTTWAQQLWFEKSQYVESGARVREMPT
jgi:hypothetical protein